MVTLLLPLVLILNRNVMLPGLAYLHTGIHNSFGCINHPLLVTCVSATASIRFAGLIGAL